MKKGTWIPRELYNKIVEYVPILSVDLVIYDEKRGVLLIKRSYPPCKGCWSLVGGGVQHSERVEEAIKRHAKTETGLEVKVERLVGIYDHPQRDSMVEGNVVHPLPSVRHTVSLAYVCAPRKGKLHPGPEALEIKFFKVLPPIIGFDHRKIILDAKVL